MSSALLVFVGGGIGALLRWATGLLAVRMLGEGWPWGTLAVNVIGGLAMGMLAAFLARAPGVALIGDEGTRLLLATGVLGGFTTFSAFSLETARMIEAGHWAGAAAYVAASVVAAVGAVFAGLALGRAGA